MSWTCPHCLRRFAREGQFHSHDVVEVDTHFAGRPPARRAAFDELVSSLHGDVRVEALKTAIILTAGTTFSYVVVRRDRLRVGVFLDRRLDSPRVVQVERRSAGKIASVVDVSGPDDVDPELRGWLADASRLRA